jgi:hydroxymethylglutaryl-CoA synthase
MGIRRFRPGISGIAVYLPRYRVGLRDWCEWTGEDWQKIRLVVGNGFRLMGPAENIYTMAASAVLRLIDQFGVDPRRVGFLALGTESSTDNSAGAVVVKGLVNLALRSRGTRELPRRCEVPEFKHACLGGVYAMKSALRFLESDGAGDLAIAVCADQALYERGSSGEPTQGAGAVAMLFSGEPTLASVDLSLAGSASDFRHLDFRKPLRNRTATRNGAWEDTPVFNGKYSTNCYLDEIQCALADFYSRRQLRPVDYLRRLPAAFLHRPYRRMPETGWGFIWLAALASGGARDREEVGELCRTARVRPGDLRREMKDPPGAENFSNPDRITDEMFPNAMSVLRVFRETETYQRRVLTQLRLGEASTAELGNLYTGALPAWLAAGLEAAAKDRVALARREILLIGYGSGDAAEAIPLRLLPAWEKTARQMRVREALRAPINLTESQYTALRDRGSLGGRLPKANCGFTIARTGRTRDHNFQDLGVEYYRYGR